MLTSELVCNMQSCSTVVYPKAVCLTYLSVHVFFIKSIYALNN